MNNEIKSKGGDNIAVNTDMNSAEIIKNAIDEFKKIQEYMALAKEENAEKTYTKLKDEYLTIKVLLNSLGVNLTDIDKIKE